MSTVNFALWARGAEEVQAELFQLLKRLEMRESEIRGLTAMVAEHEEKERENIEALSALRQAVDTLKPRVIELENDRKLQAEIISERIDTIKALRQRVVDLETERDEQECFRIQAQG